jgi:hypothetical protein
MWQAAIGLIGVTLGAVLAPGLDWMRQGRQRREDHRRQLVDMVADFISHSGDQLVAEDPATESEAGFLANAARWRLALLAPPEVAQAAEGFARASDVLRKRILAAGGWDDQQIAAEYDAWKDSESKLIEAARKHLTPPQLNP